MGSVAILLGVLVLALAFDVGFLYTRRQVIKQALDYSNMAVYREMDRNKLADGILYIDEVAGQDTFREFLARNLKLDGDLNPLPGSLAAGRVEILDFRVFNPEDLPGVDGMGHPVDEVTVFSAIRVPVRPVFSGLFATVPITVAITTDAPAGVL